MDTRAQHKGVDKEARPSSESELERIHKRPKRLSLSGKVCIVCPCYFDSDPDVKIYILDLSSEFHDDGFVLSRPTLRLDSDRFQFDGFCILGSTLFMFESSSDSVNNPKGRKSVYSFDLSSIDDSKVFDFKLDQNTLTKRRNMNHAKRYPAAVPTPDGKKILVFSTLLNYNPSPPPCVSPNYKYIYPSPPPCDPSPPPCHDRFYEDDLDCEEVCRESDFELYDPVTDSWEVLSHKARRYRDNLGVRQFSFINKSTFLVGTEVRTFTIDLCSQEDPKYWESDSSKRYGNDVCNGLFYVIEDELMVTPWGVHDITKATAQYYNSSFFRFPMSMLDNEYDFIYSSGLVTPLDGDAGKLNFCVVQPVIEKPCRLPRLIVDVYSIDHTKYREDKKEEGDGAQLEIINLQNFKFALGCKQTPCRTSCAYNAFSLPTSIDRSQRLDV